MWRVAIVLAVLLLAWLLWHATGPFGDDAEETPIHDGETAVESTTPPETGGTLVGSRSGRFEEMLREEPFLVSGSVRDADGPLARVRISLTAFSYDHESKRLVQKVFETATSTDGRYRLEGTGLATGIMARAVCPDYLPREHYLWFELPRRDGEPSASRSTEWNVLMHRELVVRGVVVDDRGRPLAGARLSYGVHGLDESLEPIETTADAEGRFALHGLRQRRSDSEPVCELVVTSERAPRPAVIADLHALDREQLKSLEIVLSQGYVLAGTAIDASGSPLPYAIVDAVYTDGLRSGTYTAADGTFRLEHLPAGQLQVEVYHFDRRQEGTTTLSIRGNMRGVQLHSETFDAPELPSGVMVLGMTVADVTPALRRAFDLPTRANVLVLKPGVLGRRRLRLQSGDTILEAGGRTITGVADLVQVMLADVDRTRTKTILPRVQLVCGVRHAGYRGNREREMPLTRREIDELRRLARELR